MVDNITSFLNDVGTKVLLDFKILYLNIKSVTGLPHIMESNKRKFHSQTLSRKREVVDHFIQNVIAYYAFVTQLKSVMEYTSVNTIYK